MTYAIAEATGPVATTSAAATATPSSASTASALGTASVVGSASDAIALATFSTGDQCSLRLSKPPDAGPYVDPIGMGGAYTIDFAEAAVYDSTSAL